MKERARILVVDDNMVNINLLKQHISQNTDHEVITAQNGAEALLVMDGSKDKIPDLVLLDVVMPGMDGFSVARRLKDSERTRDIPIIFITSLDDVESKVKAFEHGGVDYLCKPFNKDEMLARVGAHIRLKTLGDELRKKNEKLDALNKQLVHRKIDLEQLNENLDMLNRQLVYRKKELEQLNEQKNQFIGIVAHDLRNPLTAIIGTGELLSIQLDNKLNEKQAVLLARMKSSGLFMRDIINDLLDIAMIESGKLTLRAEPTDMDVLIRQTVELNNFLSEYKNITITYASEGALPGLLIDRSKMEQVLNNLLSNAVKYSYEGATVCVGARQTDAHLEISIQDRGQGINPDELKAIFDPFKKTSTKPTGGEKSTGLGLAIAKKVVEGHGGSISVESGPGQGTTFYVHLPLSRHP
jgi:two-component system, sensor histidine kinase and response regulator